MSADNQLNQLARTIAMTRDIEIDCSTCLELAPIYVDKELSGQDAAAEMPGLRQHLSICTDCFEEYEALRDLAALEREGGLPDRQTLLDQLSSDE